MDVSLWPKRAARAALGLLAAIVLGSCGNHYDLATDAGRQARVDDANLFLSEGNCQLAMNAIDPLYNSPYVDDQVRIVKASAYACMGTFNFLNMAQNLAQAGNYFNLLAKSLTNTPNDGARQALYTATDILTQGGTLMQASQRSSAVNTYMAFLQLGIVSANLRNYGNPALDGSQQSSMVYCTGNSITDPSYCNGQANPPGEMTDLDACALTASLGIFADSFAHSALTDPDTTAVYNSIVSLCVQADPTDTTCSNLALSRTSCDGTDNASLAAVQVVKAVNDNW